MALDTTMIAALANAYIIPDVKNQWKNFDALLTYLLEQQGKVKQLLGGEESFKIPLLMHKRSVVDPYTGYDVQDLSPNVQVRHGTLNWKWYYTNMIVSDEELARCQNAETTKGLLDVLKANALDTLRDEIGTDLYNTGTDAMRLNGLRQIVDATDSYAGISPATYADWAAIEDSTTNEVSLAAIANNYVQAMSGAEAPDVLASTKRIWIKVVQLLEEQKRFGSGQMLSWGPDAAGGKSDKDSPAHKYVEFMGAKFFADDYCPGTADTADNHLFGLYTPALRFMIHKDYDFAIAKDKIRPVNQFVTVIPMRFAGNLVCLKRKRNFKMSALNNSAS